METYSHTNQISVGVRVSYSRDRGHRLSLQLSDRSGVYAEIPAGTGAFNHFSIIVSQQLEDYGDTLTTAFEVADEWHTVGLTELSVQDLERAHALFPGTIIDQTSLTRMTWVGIA